MNRFPPVSEVLRERLPGALPARSKSSRVHSDFRRLLHRVHARLYPETTPVLASYWLKTVYWNGYTRKEWSELDRLLKNSLLPGAALPESWPQVVTDLRHWIRDSRGQSVHQRRPDPTASVSCRPRLGPEALVPYVIRLLNEWLPQELAQMLVREPEVPDPEPAGLPGLFVAKALERLLKRDRLSVPTLEALLNLIPISPVYVYPAHLEVLRDIILFLLGRTDAPTPAVLPATLLATLPDAALPPDYADEVARAQLVPGPAGDELSVSIPPTETAYLLAESPARFGSVTVTSDGRCWEAARFEGGEQCRIVYRPWGRLRIDDSGDRACLRLPWPDDRRSWSGLARLPKLIEIFGRQWTLAQWEKDAARTWLRLVVSRSIPSTAFAATASASLRRSVPAAADLAWAEMEIALAAAVSQNDSTALEHLQREDLVPLGRAMFAFAQFVLSRRFPDLEMMNTHLRRIRFHQSSLDPTYGLMPWRILPSPVRKVLLRGEPVWLDHLQHVFRDAPENLSSPGLLSYFTRFGAKPRRSKSPAEVSDQPSPVK